MDLLSFSVISDAIKREVNHKCKLNLSQTRILLYFGQTQNACLSMGKLADNLKISLSTLSRQLQQETTKELIEVKPSAVNSAKEVCLSEQGLTKLSELKVVLAELEQQLFTYWDEQELSVFNSQLSMIGKRLNNSLTSDDHATSL